MVNDVRGEYLSTQERLTFVKLAYRIALRPSRSQRNRLAQHAGCARKAWNWGLRRKKEDYLETGKSPSAVDLHRELNLLKKVPKEDGGFPWMYESSKCAPQEALRDLDTAFVNFFRRCREGAARKGYPRRKKRRPGEGSFRLTGAIRVEEGHVVLPRIGAVRIQPGCRDYAPAGAYTSVSVVQEHGEWFASVREERPETTQVDVETAPRIGIDLGVRKLATLSDGMIIENPRHLRAASKRLRRRQKVVSRRKKGSGRRRRAVRHLSRAHRRVKNLRRDAIHQATHTIVTQHPVVVVEDLHVQNMTRRRRGKGRAAKAGLNRAVLDAAFREFRRQLDYKLKLRGGHLLIVPAPYTSQDCSRCGARNDPGTSETYRCASCGLVIDRDVNAAKNIVAASWSDTQNARGVVVRPRGSPSHVAAVVKREREQEAVCI